MASGFILQLRLFFLNSYLSLSILLKLFFHLTPQVTGTCDGSAYFKNCTGQARFSRYDFTTPIIIDWLKITAAEMCLPRRAYRFGFTEVKAMGRFMRN